MRNLRFAIRTLTGARASLFAIAVLALGIGMSTSIFSLAHAVLFHALPFPNQDSLRVIWKADPKAGVPFLELAYPELRDLQQGVPAFESVAVMPTTLYGYGKVILAGNRKPIQVESAPVSHGFFRTLGVSPILGRDFTDADEHPGAGPVVILGNRIWRSHFYADARIVGGQISLNGQGYTVIGVVARDVDFPRGVGLWVPLGVNENIANRAAYYLQAIARVKPGYSDDRVNAQVNSLFTRLAREYPGFYSPTQQAVVTALPKYWVGSARLQLLISLAASFLLLATACITASNLFLSRALARRQEVATRSSLGATASQIFAQFAVEGVTAASLAGVVGLCVAWMLIKFFVASAPSEIPRLTGAGINWQVFLWAAALSLLAALACSIAPTVIATHVNLDVLLRGGGARLTATRRGHRMQSAFTIAQTAITVVLLASSLLVVISVRSMLRTDIGFAHLDAVTMNLAVRGPQVDASRRHLFYTRLLNRLRESPAVTTVGAVLVRPLEGAIGWDMHYESEFDTPRRREERSVSNFEVITPGYFETVGTPLLEGREFSSHDTEETEKAVIISSGLAQRMHRLGHEPVGTRIRFGTHGDGPWWKIVGVTGNTRYRGIATRDEDIYVCYLQTGIPVNYLVIRGRATANELAALVRQQVAALDPNQAIANVATIEQLIARDTARQRFNMALLLTFGATALLLAAAGVYSVVAESVTVRTREIAIRLALGAERRILTRQFVAGVLRSVLIGELLGLLTLLAAGPFLVSLLYAIGPRDPPVLTAVLVFLLVVSAFAASIPAWIAAGQESIAKKLAQAP